MRLALLVVLAACATPRLSEGVVRTSAGLVAGVRAGETWTWKGIPYAAPPVGPLRWRAPQPAAAWSGVRDASGYGYVCMQSPRSNDPRGTPMGSEDCLTLNVWAPAERAQPLPVFVFIHGGYFTWGSSAQRHEGVDVYDGAHLSTQAHALVVTLNYRLGPLGFLAHPKLSAESPSGDYGLLDQLAALQWVQQNIAAFGGDPTHVMLFGQSAGAISTASLVASPLAKGLFSSAVMHSGTGWARPLLDAEKEGVAMSHALGCEAAADELACLRGRSASEIIAAGPEDYAPGQYMWGPVVDGRVLTAKPWELIARGKHNAVPLIVGTTADEFTTMIRNYEKMPLATDAQYEAAVRARFPEKADAVLAHYPSSALGGPDAALTTLLTDVGFVCPSDALAASATRSQGAPVRRFNFTHTYSSGYMAAVKAGHGLDLLLLFHNVPPAWTKLTDEEEALSKSLTRYWARFAATGDPNGDGDASWPEFRYGKDTVLDLDTPVSLGGSVETCKWWWASARK
jgi:para-nitrobenzyl esterase